MEINYEKHSGEKHFGELYRQGTTYSTLFLLQLQHAYQVTLPNQLLILPGTMGLSFLLFLPELLGTLFFNMIKLLSTTLYITGKLAGSMVSMVVFDRGLTTILREDKPSA